MIYIKNVKVKGETEMSLFEPKVKKELRKYLRENDFNFVSSGGYQDKDRLSKLWGRYSMEDEDYRKITVELESKSATVSKQEGKSAKVESLSIPYDSGMEALLVEVQKFVPYLTDALD